MVSILKVDTIKKTNDSVPTVADLGISTTGLGPNILQVVSSGIINSQFQTASGSYVTTNCDVNITPSATTSKVLVFANITGYYIFGGGTDHGGSGAIYRDSTELYGSNARFGYQRDNSSSNQEIAIPLVLQHLDTPSTTSQITYGIYMSAHAGGTVWTNNHDRCIIVMEIAG
tara:strand:- start:9845 stop:10360 length:516 start_codon:yes stop_codon:yes gene_type:complete